MALRHNSQLAKREPAWSQIDKTRLPRVAFADRGDAGKKSTWRYPHHWVSGGSRLNDQGVYVDGTLYLHRGGLIAAWAAARGARSGQRASADVLDHLRRHRRAIGLEADLPATCLLGDGQVEVQAAADGNGERDGGGGLSRVDILAYTGSVMDVGWPLPVVVDLERLRIGRQKQPILRQHDPRTVVGHTDQVTIEGGRLRISGVLSGPAEVVAEVVETARRGFPWQASVGVGPEKVRRLDEGDTETINGRLIKGPVYIVSGRLKEISIVPVGADDQTSVSVRAEDQGMTFEQWLQAEGWDVDKLTDEEKATLRAAYEQRDVTEPDTPSDTSDGLDQSGGRAVTAAAPEPKAVQAQAAVQRDLDALRQQTAQEIERINAIRRIVAQYQVQTIRVGDEQVDLAAHAIRNGWSVERTELEALRASRPQAPAVQSRDSQPNGAAVEAALCLSAGLKREQVLKWYGEQAVERAERSDLEGAGIHTVLDLTVRAAGRHARMDRITDDTIRTAFEAERSLAASGYSTVSLSGILGNVANKALLAAFTAVQRATPRLADQVDHSDFKQHTKYRLTAVGRFEKVGPDGELKSAELSEDSYTNQLDTYGRIITLTRQQIVNDDLGAFLRIPRLLGRQAALALERAAFELLLSNPSNFFSAGNNNYLSGGTSALSVDGLTSAIEQFGKLTDAAGEPILVEPRILLVPASLRGTAENLMGSQFLITGETKTRPQSNPWVGRFEVVYSPYLDAQGLTGSSTTAWYLFADPADVAALEVAYLRGRRTPTIERGDTDFATLGVQWRGYWDFGVAMGDPRGAVKSDGV